MRKELLRIGLAALSYLFFIGVVCETNDGQVEVRAVFINCEPEEKPIVAVDNAASRFEREELFKHSALRDCHKKIALTVKIVNNPNTNNEDEYIPIEHVFQGSKRVKLLNPYVLRLKREAPYQIYKLRKIDIVNGVLEKVNENTPQRFRRSTTAAVGVLKNHVHVRHANYSVFHKPLYEDGKHYDFPIKSTITSKCDLRGKRHVPSDVEDAVADTNIAEWNDVNSFIQNDNIEPMRNRKVEKNVRTHKSNSNRRNNINVLNTDTWNGSTKEDPVEEKASISDFSNNEYVDVKKIGYSNDSKRESTEKYFSMYEIEKPDIWYDIHVQLFEKLNTQEGQPVWHDVAKGAFCVSSHSPECKGQGFDVKYRSAEWIPREDFILPPTSLCLLVRETNKMGPMDEYDSDKYELQDKYIIVPKEDITNLNVENVKAVGENVSQYFTETTEHLQHPRVLIRLSRALNENKLKINQVGGEDYLVIPHTKPHQSFVDLEARADDNQLVTVGSSGRIITIVSENTRRTRTVLNVQVSNTGLAASRFRVNVRDCGPVSPENQLGDKDMSKYNEISMLLPPRHTRSVRLNLLNDVPADVAHCAVALLNDDGESVAVRDVAIKKGDRCFCVWYCDCVCLSDDPKLLCHEMPEGRQVAAGLSLRERTRRARSICYHDVVSVDLLVTALGVILALLFFGFVKAVLGLVFRCIGCWGLHRIVQMPRKLDHYYERSIREMNVVYDEEGWPVHPETLKRTVRLISRPMEFVLNLVYFIVAPCVIVYDIVKHVCGTCKRKKRTNSTVTTEWRHLHGRNEKYFNARDIQASSTRRSRRRRLTRWMTSEAEDLSTDLWQTGLQVQPTEVNLEPLLGEEAPQERIEPTVSRPVDSDVEDTEYVLMQMQKSRESLARSQRKMRGVQSPLNVE